MTALFWFTRDLRVRDHPALRAALDGHDHVIPVFCFDDRLLGGRHASGPRTQFLLECLRELDGALRERGSGLVVVHGRPERELPRLARETGASEIHCSADSGPFAADAGRAIEPVELCEHLPGPARGRRPRRAQHRPGTPFRVFTPFHRAWLNAPRRAPLARRARCRRCRRAAQGAASVARGARARADGRRPAARAGRRRPAGASAGSSTGRCRATPTATTPSGVDGTSRLSPYLHFGCLSPRELEQRLPRGAGAEAFQRQLCWRDFHHHVLLHNPDNAHREFQPRYRQLRWSRDRRAVRCLVRRRDRLSARRRRHAAAAARGLDAQPCAARGRLVPDQGPRHRLALGRALVHALAGRRRRGQQQRQLAVDRIRGHRPAARLPAPLQPGAASGALRPRGRLRAALRARAGRRARRPSQRAVGHAGGGPARVRLRDRPRLPRSGRRPPAGAAARRSSATGRREVERRRRRRGSGS